MLIFLVFLAPLTVSIDFLDFLMVLVPILFFFWWESVRVFAMVFMCAILAEAVDFAALSLESLDRNLTVLKSFPLIVVVPYFLTAALTFFWLCIL